MQVPALTEEAEYAITPEAEHAIIPELEDVTKSLTEV